MFVKPIESQMKEAIEDIELNHHMHSRVMYNLEDGEVWTDVFVSCNEWKSYRNDKIIQIYSGNVAPSYEYLYETTMNYRDIEMRTAEYKQRLDQRVGRLETIKHFPLFGVQIGKKELKEP